MRPRDPEMQSVHIIILYLVLLMNKCMQQFVQQPKRVRSSPRLLRHQLLQYALTSRASRSVSLH